MRAIALIFVVAILWAVAGILVGLGLSAYVQVNWIFECGSLNLAIGMIWLQIITRTEVGRRIFYEGVKEEDDDAGLGIAFLWAIPFSMVPVNPGITAVVFTS